MAFCNLPEELMVPILTRLPVKSLYRFKSVCKSWLLLISSSDFVALHRDNFASNPENHALLLHNHYKLAFKSAFLFFNANSSVIKATKLNRDYFPVMLAGSCNGLVGLFCQGFRNIFLWNPATSQQKSIRVPERLQPLPYPKRYSVGMGFDSTTNDFKVLSIISEDPKGLKVDANVYSVNRDRWENVSLEFKFQVDCVINDAIVCGVPYWRGLVEGFNEVYVRFDVKNGVFNHIPIPKLDIKSDATIRLVEWKYCLAALVHLPGKKNVVGVMIFDECQREWSTQFNIAIPIATEIKYCKGTEILLETPDDRKLFLFDPETNRTKEVCAGDARKIQPVGVVFNYIESLVHLEGMKIVKEIEGHIQFDLA